MTREQPRGWQETTGKGHAYCSSSTHAPYLKGFANAIAPWEELNRHVLSPFLQKISGLSP